MVELGIMVGHLVVDLVFGLGIKDRLRILWWWRVDIWKKGISRPEFPF